MTRSRWLLFAALIACGRSSPPSKTDGSYQGRTIAPACSHLGADWLERPDREAREQPDRVLALLQVSRGMTVADVGAGTGYFTVRLAHRVGASGKVLATDVQPEMLRKIDARLGREQITNVQLIRGTERSAELPARCCDLVLLVDVYHELADPPSVMAGIRRALKDTGKLALVEYRAEDPTVPIRPEQREASPEGDKMSLSQIRQELEPLGFAFVTSIEELPDQRIVVFTRDDVIPTTPAGQRR
ncbi:MAG: class I SAM-dependent methyltransferase [Kofleriaceae bacterium]